MAEPAAGFHYSNTNYLLLGEIIEKVTSKPWYAEVRSRIIEPLGLKHTGYAGEPSAPRLGAGYVIEDGRFVEGTDRWHPSIGGAAGAMYSTTADLLAFTLALFEGRLLDATRTAEMQTFVPARLRSRRPCLMGLGSRAYTVNRPDGLAMGTAARHSASSDDADRRVARRWPCRSTPTTRDPPHSSVPRCSPR
jgi:D-alanyl-D-alanine carboxypeptidase